jgi:hypothetical protein
MSTYSQLGVWLSAVGLCCGVSTACGSPNSPGSGLSDPSLGGSSGTQMDRPGMTTSPTQTGTSAGSAAITPPSSVTAGAPSNTGPITGTAGTPAVAPPVGGAPPPVDTGGSAAPPMPGAAPAMDECGIHTNYAGDEYCIKPPPADKGFQLHIGPSNYDKPEQQYILAPGAELTTDFPTTSTNDKEIYFYYRQYRMRPGAHHDIITSGGGGDSGLGQRIGTVNTLTEDYPRGGVIAPENKGVGIRMPAKTSINVSLHSINTTQKAQLREIWVNFWYRDPTEVTDPVKEVFAIAPMQGIPPHADVMVNGSCTTSGEGRMLWAYGHRHANNVRFSVWHQGGGKKDLVYQGYSWEEPITFDYSSTVMNPVPDTAPMVEGGWSGILPFKSGDQFTFECHVVNKTNGTLNFTNNTFTGEMCILDAETVGGGCN